MDRSGTIVYLGTEGNAKSCLGLAHLLGDGWRVALVVAYVADAGRGGGASPRKRLRRAAGSALRACPVFRLACRRLRQRRPRLEFPRLEQTCVRHGVAYEPTEDTTLAACKQQIAELEPDVLLSNGWQFRVPPEIFSLARVAALNCHSSYLPEYRGGNVTFAPLINEETRSGVTVHEMVWRFDAGRILAQQRVPIEPGETPASLNAKRARATGQVLIRALQRAGHEHLYKPNPPSPFYPRCDYATYRRYRRANRLRKLLGLPIKRYEPRPSPTRQPR
ncbi:MAG: formyltransferase family protein [Candidatus Brocadiia bacterium]